MHFFFYILTFIILYLLNCGLKKNSIILISVFIVITSVFYLYTAILIKNYNTVRDKIVYNRISDIEGKIENIYAVTGTSLNITLTDCIINGYRTNYRIFLKTDRFNFKNGSSIKFQTKIKPPVPYLTSINYLLNVHYNNNGVLGFANIKSENIQFISQKNNSYALLRYSFHNKLKKNLEKYIDNKVSFKIIFALLTGNKEVLYNKTELIFQKAGIYHILAISGLHTGIVVYMVYLFLSMFKTGKKLKFIVTVILIIIFYLFIGFKISVFRAALMIILIMFGMLLEKDIDMFNILLFVVFIIVLWKPLEIFEIGFQLSFGAVLGIICFMKKIKSLLSFLPNFAASLFAVTISAQIITVPLIAYHFNKIYIYSIFANLFAVPLAGIILPVIYFVLVLDILNLTLAKFSAAFLNSLLWLLNKLAVSVSSLPFSSVNCYLKLEYLIFFLFLLFTFKVARTKNKFIVSTFFLIISFAVYSL